MNDIQNLEISWVQNEKKNNDYKCKYKKKKKNNDYKCKSNKKKRMGNCY